MTFAITETWHIIIPLLLHLRHLDAITLIGVCRQLNSIVNDAYQDLGSYQKLAYICSITRRRMTTRIDHLIDHVIKLKTIDEISAILVASSSECYWGIVDSIEKDGRLWKYLDTEWSMSASKYHTHALAMSGVFDQPRWLSFFRAQKDAGILTDAQFFNVRVAFYSRVLATLDNITKFHNALASSRVTCN